MKNSDSIFMLKLLQEISLKIGYKRHHRLKEDGLHFYVKFILILTTLEPKNSIDHKINIRKISYIPF